MSKVDWSLAPEWATHALVKLHNPGVGGVYWSYFIDGEHRISPDGLWFHPDGYRVADERPRNLKPKPWSGPEDGLPPVGEVVEVFDCSHAVTKRFNNQMVTIVAHHKSRAVFEAGDCDYHGLVKSKFRRVRTAEQLAAENRETAIRELMDIAQVDCRVTAARLVDAGFKREGV